MAASHAWRRHAPVTPDHAERISETLIAYYAKVSPPCGLAEQARREAWRKYKRNLREQRRRGRIRRQKGKTTQ